MQDLFVRDPAHSLGGFLFRPCIGDRLADDRAEDALQLHCFGEQS